jgi:hypothetical protein
LKATLTESQLSELGPEVLPFERIKFTRFVEVGEDILFDNFIHNVTILGVPTNVVRTQAEAILQNMAPLQKYLWDTDKIRWHRICSFASNFIFVYGSLYCPH